MILSPSGNTSYLSSSSNFIENPKASFTGEKSGLVFRILFISFSVTSFLVGGFEMAPACLKAVKDSGLKVPEDISIICYIDNEIMPLLDPSLTAIKWPYYDMGKKAALILLEKGDDKKRYIFETELVIRDSTSANR